MERRRKGYEDGKSPAFLEPGRLQSRPEWAGKGYGWDAGIQSCFSSVLPGVFLSRKGCLCLLNNQSMPDTSGHFADMFARVEAHRDEATSVEVTKSWNRSTGT